jgi:hypothetical protein
MDGHKAISCIDEKRTSAVALCDGNRSIVARTVGLARIAGVLNYGDEL